VAGHAGEVHRHRRRLGYIGDSAAAAAPRLTAFLRAEHAGAV